MKTIIQNLFHRFTSWWRERWHLSLEYLALRHQLEVLKRSGKRPQCSSSDRCFWLFLASWWPKWPQTLEIMQADTVQRWRRQGIWHHLRWRRGRRRPGRPPIPAETRKLIREMRRDNRFWGAPRIRGELLKLDIKVSQTTMAKYMLRRPNSPSPTWRTFIYNQTPELFSTELDAELADHVRAVLSQLFQVLQRWIGQLLIDLQHPVRRCHESLYTARIYLVSVPITWALDSDGPINMSSRSPPSSHTGAIYP